MNMNTLVTIVVSAVAGALAALAVVSVPALNEKSPEKLIAEFYEIENAVHVSPHSLRRELDAGGGKTVVVDLRSRTEYEREHIVGAVNIPAYADPNTSAYGDVDRIVAQFRALASENPGKDIVTYCYSIPCMTGRKIGKMLAERGIYVKTLGIGWNEWRHFWTLWNHEHEWETTRPEDYVVVSGAEPGKPVQRELPPPCGGEFSC